MFFDDSHAAWLVPGQATRAANDHVFRRMRTSQTRMGDGDAQVLQALRGAAPTSMQRTLEAANDAGAR